MSNLVNKNKIGSPTGGLHARLNQKKLEQEILKEATVNLPNRLALMLDCSGSMHGDSIDLLKQAVQDFITRSDDMTTSLMLESFPSGIIRTELLADKTILWMMCAGLTADGSTPLTEAMQYCIEKPITRGLIISDGGANDPIGARSTAVLYKNKEIMVDTIHIGSSTSGEELLKEIASITGGMYIKFKDIASFSSSFHFLLPETRQEAARLMLGAGANEVR